LSPDFARGDCCVALTEPGGAVWPAAALWICSVGAVQG